MIFLQDFLARFQGFSMHDASDVDIKRGIQGTFNALFLILIKSIILSLPCFFSPMIVYFFIFAGFASQIKSKIRKSKISFNCLMVFDRQSFSV